MTFHCKGRTRIFFVLKMTGNYEKVSFRGTRGQRRLADRLCLQRQISDLNGRRAVNKTSEKQRLLWTTHAAFRKRALTKPVSATVFAGSRAPRHPANRKM